ncbi:MAG TPA: hypothetical protein VH764_00795 [Gemmatimonadales bacterium]|jgi:hypothetical protein
MSGGFRGLSALALLASCGGANAGQADPKACAPVEAAASDLTAAGLDGAYTVQLIATSGEKQGASAGGRLELRAQDSAFRSMQRSDGTVDTTFSFPLYGTAEVDFAAVGASTPGDAASSDPQSPGVLVIQRPGGVMLRLGSEANRRGVRRFDGGYTVLQVQQVTDSGFAGTWRSAVGLEESGGHFCAVRAT